MKLAVITVRVPPIFHAALKELAWSRKQSLNQLCVKVLQAELDKAALARAAGRPGGCGRLEIGE